LLLNGGDLFLRYFFHLNCGSGPLLDDLGREFDSHTSALAHAFKLADMLEKERFGAAWERYVSVADETGEEVGRVFVAGRSRIESKVLALIAALGLAATHLYPISTLLT